MFVKINIYVNNRSQEIDGICFGEVNQKLRSLAK